MGIISRAHQLAYTRVFNVLGVLVFALGTILAATLPVQAAGGDRTLFLYYTHTKETKKFTFRKGGRYDQGVLNELNVFLRDWRRNEPTKMDPALFDLVWEVYQEAGATGPIHIVSAYRAPATNEALRSKSSGVAKNSRHTMGMAMDFFVPGVPISKLREIAMRKQTGGVGYYPTSGSPFVHLDTGSVRAWPRMTRAQLQKIFPDGKTMHLPSDGTPLSQSGYAWATAEYKKCHAIPCSGRSTAATIRVAQQSGGGSGGGLLGWLFGDDEDEENEIEAASSAPIAVASVAPAAPAKPPFPAALPVGLRSAQPASEQLPFGFGSDPLVAEPQDGAIAVAALDAPIPAARPDWIGSAAAATDTLAVASIAPAPLPANRPGAIGATQATPDPLAPILAAYAPVAAPEPDAQRALRMILERRTEAEKAAKPELNTTGMRLSLASADAGANSLGALLEGTMSAVEGAGGSLPPTATLSLSLQARAAALVAPKLNQVTDILVDPAALSSSRYAIVSEQSGADFSPATELGRFASRVTINSDPTFGLGLVSFTPAGKLLVAAR